MSEATYEARPAGCRPTSRARGWGGTFSVPIGAVVPEGRRKPAAIYRVRGNVRDEKQVDALAGRLVSWLNSSDREWKKGRLDGWLRSPSGEIEVASGRSARIEITKAGKKAGFRR